MPEADKPLVWLRGEVKTPPLNAEARLEAGILLRRLQRGESLTMPHSRTMPSIGPRCHELRIRDRNVSWRIMYRHVFPTTAPFVLAQMIFFAPSAILAETR